MSPAGPTPQGGSESGLTVRPHWMFVVFFPIRQYAGIAMLSLCAWLGLVVWGWAGFRAPAAPGLAWLIGGGAFLARLVWATLQWATRAYGLSDGGRLWAAFGVLNRRRNEVGVEQVRSVSVDKPFFQRLLGLGSIGFATAATSGFEVAWVIVADPDGLAARVGSADSRPPISETESGAADGE